MAPTRTQYAFRKGSNPLPGGGVYSKVNRIFRRCYGRKEIRKKYSLEPVLQMKNCHSFASHDHSKAILDLRSTEAKILSKKGRRMAV